MNKFLNNPTAFFIFYCNPISCTVILNLFHIDRFLHVFLKIVLKTIASKPATVKISSNIKNKFKLKINLKFSIISGYKS